MPSITVFVGTGVEDSSSGGTKDWTDGTLANASANDGTTLNSSPEGSSGGNFITYYYRAPIGDVSSIPAGSTINGIEVEIEKSKLATTVTDEFVRLYKAGTGFVGDNKADTSTNYAHFPSFTIANYGGAIDLWGTTWTRDEVVNDLEVGIACDIDGAIGGFNPDIGIDYIEVTVHYAPPTIEFSATLDLNWSGSASIVDAATDFDFKWSIEHIEASTTHGFPSVYIDISSSTQPSGAFPTGDVYERRLTEIPRLQEVNLDSRSGVSGFQRVSLQVDNHDGLLNSFNIQDAFVRIFFIDEGGNTSKEFHGKIVDWSLSHVTTINVEDIDVLAFRETLPKRTLNDIVEAEKAALSGPGQETELADFTNSVVADDLGKPIPIIFGRAVKVPLLYIKADEANREYDYIIGEGVGLNGNNFEQVFTVYREDKALDVIDGDVGVGTTDSTLVLEFPDRRPNEWYTYWWASIVSGTGSGQIRDTTMYDSASNTISISGLTPWSPVPNTFSDYRLTEYQLFDGNQTAPYAGYAFIRFKKRLGTTNRTDDLFADVDGLQDETNRARAIQSILSNPDWGLGLSVDAMSFFDAAAEMSSISSFTCEGAILSETTAIDILSKLLSFRDMVLSKDADIEITVDSSKPSTFNFGLGDETGFNNIINENPTVNYIHPNEKVKDLKVRYRKNHKENDTYLHEFTRPANQNGVDDTLDLPFVYDHVTADHALDYKRKRLTAADRNLSLDVGKDGGSVKRGDRAKVDIPSLGISSDWEVTSTNVTPAGSNSVDLVPYDESPYSYIPFTSEGGTLPADESFDIQPDLSNTPPDPVSVVITTPGFEIQDDLTRIGFIDVSWTPPNDGNYLEGKVRTKVTGAADSTYIEHPHGFDLARAIPLKVGLTYDVLVTSINQFNLESYGIPATGILIPGDNTIPKTPVNVIGKGKFNGVSWEWDAVTENTDNSTIEDLKGYEYRVWNSSSGGTQQYPKDGAIGFTTDTRVDIIDNDGDLTTNGRNLYLEVRAVDDSGNTSSYTNPRVLAGTDTILQNDVTDGEITGVARVYTPGVTTSTPMQSVSITLRGGQPVDIDISFFLPNVTSGHLLLINRGVTNLYSNNVIGFQQPGTYHIKYVDPSPPAGAHTYTLSGTGFGSMSHRSMSVEERRR